MKALARGWTTSSLGQIADLIMGQSPESKYYSEEKIGLPFLQGCAEFQARFPRSTIFCRQIKKVAPEKSILFGVRAPVGRINIADQPYVIGRGLAAIIGVKVEQDYLEQCFHYQESTFRNVSQGSTFEAINSSELYTWPITYPIDRGEQSKIAEVLSKVDQAIEQTESLIAKQQRIKTGLMQDLLTRGIDEHGNLRSEETHQFKDSPLGRIPVEWEVMKVRDVFETRLGKMLSQKAKEGNNAAYYLRNVNVQWEKIDTSSMEWMDFSAHERKKYGLKRGDILVCEGGEVGRSCVWMDQLQNCYYQKAIHRLRAKIGYMSELFPIYMQWMIRHGHLTDYTSKTSIAHLTKENIDALDIVIPEYTEQRRLYDIFSKYNLDIQLASNQLEKLRSFKIALMQDLLTGRVRVTPLMQDTEAIP